MSYPRKPCKKARSDIPAPESGLLFSVRVDWMPKKTSHSEKNQLNSVRILAEKKQDLNRLNLIIAPKIKAFNDINQYS